MSDDRRCVLTLFGCSVHVQQAVPQRGGGEQGGLQELRCQQADRHLVYGQRLRRPQDRGPPLLPLRLPGPLRRRPEGGHPHRRLLWCPFRGAHPRARSRRRLQALQWRHGRAGAAPQRRAPGPPRRQLRRRHRRRVAALPGRGRAGLSVTRGSVVSVRGLAPLWIELRALLCLLPFEQERLDLRSFCCFALVVLWILACLGDFFLLSISFLMLWALPSFISVQWYRLRTICSAAVTFSVSVREYVTPFSRSRLPPRWEFLEQETVSMIASNCLTGIGPVCFATC